jgi:hypothetical protein
MKIKTITCHDVYNYGASLQSFALMKYLQSLGHDVKVIDYKPAYMAYKLWAVGERWKRNPLLRILFFAYVIPRRLILKKRRVKFDQFTQNVLQLTSKRYHSNEELKEDPPEADVYFAGSDQIWNTSHHNGKDPSFYLDFVPEKSIKASYAASFSIKRVPDEYKEFVRSKLIRLDAISVRETSGLEILDSLQIEGGHVVMDPVFLLKRDMWNDLLKSTPKGKYIFIYDQENNPMIRNIAKRISASKGYRIYAIESLYPKFYAHKRIIVAGPLEFLTLIKNCEICLTNSFHATAFSLIFEKDFVTFRRMHEKVNSRMEDLLTTLDLRERIFENENQLNQLKAINYTDVLKKIEDRVNNSKAYIHSVIQLIN